MIRVTACAGGAVDDPHEKRRALCSAVFDPGGLDFSYDGMLTLTAAETFERATGNCLSLANFFVAAVRHLRIEAHYQEIRRGRICVLSISTGNTCRP